MKSNKCAHNSDFRILECFRTCPFVAGASRDVITRRVVVLVGRLILGKRSAVYRVGSRKVVSISMSCTGVVKKNSTRSLRSGVFRTWEGGCRYALLSACYEV